MPLPNASLDVAVFCLALMGTDWIKFVEEAMQSRGIMSPVNELSDVLCFASAINRSIPPKNVFPVLCVLDPYSLVFFPRRGGGGCGCRIGGGGGSSSSSSSSLRSSRGSRSCSSSSKGATCSTLNPESKP